MSIDPRMVAALNAIYAAATDENLWPEVIRDLLNITESQAASFCVLDGSDLPRLPIFSYINVESRSVDESRFLNEYLEGGMVQQDPTVQFIVAHPHQHLFLDCELGRPARRVDRGG